MATNKWYEIWALGCDADYNALPAEVFIEDWPTLEEAKSALAYLKDSGTVESICETMIKDTAEVKIIELRIEEITEDTETNEQTTDICDSQYIR